MQPGLIIGGSPSTGSSLLVRILDRHSAISAGPETYLFMHPPLYEQWDRYKPYLIQTSKWRGLKSRTWFQMNGAQLHQATYQWPAKERNSLIERAPDFASFAQAFMSRRMHTAGASIWVEKSPANSITFPDFLSIFPHAGIIHTIRDPYDTVASLVARGNSPYAAAGAYIVQTALGLRCLDHPRAYIIRYEDLVQKAISSLTDLLHFIGLPWEEGLLQPDSDNGAEGVRMAGWLQSENQRIGQKSMGRFKLLPPSEQEPIINALGHFRIHATYARRYGLKHTDLSSIAKSLGYPFISPSLLVSKALKKQKRRDQFSRALRCYAFYGKYYPGSLS